MYNQVWENDLLNRKEEGEFLYNYLLKRYKQNKDSSFVLNINAEWGFGKTYFLENLSKEIANKNHPVVYFDAWKNDYTKEPLLAFISEIDTSLNQYFSKSKKAKTMVKNIIDSSKSIFLPIISKKLTGLGIDELNEIMDKEESSEKSEEENKEGNTQQEIENAISSVITKAATLALNEHNTIKESIIKFKDNMTILLNYIDKNLSSKELPMFIFIDELDRCRPNYSIELLENIKHLFNIPGVIFVVATDSQQLSHSINAVYGQKFSSERYLKRFFDQEYNLVKPDSYSFSKYLFEINGILNCEKLYSPLDEEFYNEEEVNVKLFSLFVDYFKVGLRDQEQIMVVLSTVILTWEFEESIHLSYLLYLIILKQKSSSKFNEYNESSKNNKREIMKEVTSSYKVNNLIELKTRKNQREYINGIMRTISSKEVGFSIKDFIDQYIEISTLNLEKLYEIQERGYDYHLYSNLINKLIRELPNSYNSNNVPKHKLEKYTELILRAGQFS